MSISDSDLLSLNTLGIVQYTTNMVQITTPGIVQIYTPNIVQTNTPSITQTDIIPTMTIRPIKPSSTKLPLNTPFSPDVSISDYRYSHDIVLNKISGYTFANKYTKDIIKKFKNNDNNFDSNDYDDLGESFNEVWAWYLGIEESYTLIYPYAKENNYRFYKLSDADFKKGVAKLKKIEADTIKYKNFIYGALNNMNLFTSDKDLVNQINLYIVKNFKYKITDNSHIYSFVKTKYGQCYHYANLFKDMCNAVGIECYYLECIKNQPHAINIVVVDDKKYYFDVTSNDTSGKYTSYSWMTEAEARKLYTW